MSTPSLTRRDALKGAAGLAALGALPASARARARDRVAIIGAGMGGVAAAYFLAGRFHVDVFEARSRIGGHCDSRHIEHRGRRLTVDLGAQFFHPDTHPIYVTLLEELGLGTDTMFKAPASLCIFRVADDGAPVFSSIHALATPAHAVDFATFTQLARQAVLTDMAWETTVEEWISSLPLQPAFKKDVLYPWITATIGCTRHDARRTSARSILQTFALAFPANVLEPASTYTSRIGLQGNLQRMLDRTPTARIHRCAPAQNLTRTRSGWFVRTPSGTDGPYRYVVLNAPPRAGRELLRPLPAFADVTELLDEYRYFDSRLLIHTDPAYMPADRGDWSAYNAGIEGRDSEGSAWLGALHDKPALHVFKSWAERRRADPEHIVLARRFKHPLIRPSTIAAARALRPLQGRKGLYFSGQYTTGMDLQESALYSAMQVAEALAPGGRKLASLHERLRARGLAGISYDL